MSRETRDAQRRRITLSKLEKFERLARVQTPSEVDLEATYGKISKDNDRVDVLLLHALAVGSVDFLVTEDQGIHNRARRIGPEFADRVMTVADAVGWLASHYEPKSVNLPLVEEVPAHSIDMTDEFFKSLKGDYPGFEAWWREKCIPNHRPCWQLTVDGELAGLVVRKDETHGEAQTSHAGPKILKLCTFKVKAKFRGEKLGELLLKQALWFAQRNSYDLVYLTTFRQQQTLINVLEYFGFERSGLNENGEDVYEKPMSRMALNVDPTDNRFDAARLHYPRFLAGQPSASHTHPGRVSRPPVPGTCRPQAGRPLSRIWSWLTTDSHSREYNSKGLCVSREYQPDRARRCPLLLPVKGRCPVGAACDNGWGSRESDRGANA